MTMTDREKTIDGWLVLDWKNEKIRARKTKPNASDLGTNDLVAELEVTVTVPEVDVPNVSADFEVPEPMVTSAVAEALDNRQLADWERDAESLIAEEIDTIREADDGELDAIVNSLTIQTLRSARGRPDIDAVQRYIEAAIGEIRG